MATRPIYVLDAFTEVPLEGNPAGVVPLSRGLSEAQMLAIAREIQVSETAFVFPTEVADVKVRFFTPTQEVPFCGHAFVATMALLAELGEIQVTGSFSRVRVETGVGILSADLVKDVNGLRVDMTQAEPAFRPFSHPADRVLEILGADLSDLRTSLPLELACTGLWHLIVPMTGLDAIDGLMPDFRALAALNREVGVLTTHVFAEDGGGFVCRGFAPAAGVDEDPFTGSACGALAAYLLRHGAVRADTPIKVLQGDACRRPGEARVVVGGTREQPGPVVVGGRAVVCIRGEMAVGQR